MSEFTFLLFPLQCITISRAMHSRSTGKEGPGHYQSEKGMANLTPFPEKQKQKTKKHWLLTCQA